MPHDNCPYINELYQNWSSLVSQLESLKDKYIREGSKELEEEFNSLKEEVREAKERYLSEMERVIEYDNREIFLKDVIILEYLRERVRDFSWNTDNNRVTFINLSNKEIPPDVRYFPDDLQQLDLDNAKIENPEKLNFPDSLQVLSLDNAKIENPENLKLPDNLQRLYLQNIKITKELREMLNKYRKRNSNVDILL